MMYKPYFHGNFNSDPIYGLTTKYYDDIYSLSLSHTIFTSWFLVHFDLV